MPLELYAYADESGVHDAAKYCVIAGWIGSPQQWRKFNEDWKTVLNRFGVTEFHSTEFFGRKHNRSKSNPYRDWSDGRAHHFLDALTESIAQRRLYPIGGAVDVGVFMSYPEGVRRFFTSAQIKPTGKWTTTGAPSRPYQIAFPILLTEATQAAKPGAIVNFVLDQNEKEAALALQVFTEMKNERRHELWERLGGITFSDRRQDPGLQAADLNVHLWYSFLENGAEHMGEERHRALRPLKKRRDSMRVGEKQFFDGLRAKLSPEQLRRLERRAGGRA